MKPLDKGEVMKRVFMLVVCAVILAGCATNMPVGLLLSGVRLPVSANGGPASKEGKAICSSFMFLISTGDCSVNAAMKNGKIARVSYMDWEVDNVFGLQGTYTLHVYGE
jgi:hypothetical protein